MSDVSDARDDPDEPGESPDSAAADEEEAAEAEGETREVGGSRLREFLNYGLLAGLLLLALVAAVGFYTAVSSAITTWVADEWRPLFRAAFNLAVLLVAGAGIAWQARRVA